MNENDQSFSNNSTIELSDINICHPYVDDLKECFICMDTGKNLCHGVCKCNTMMHTYCQKKLIKTSQSIYCKVFIINHHI